MHDKRLRNRDLDVSVTVCVPLGGVGGDDSITLDLYDRDWPGTERLGRITERRRPCVDFQDAHITRFDEEEAGEMPGARRSWLRRAASAADDQEGDHSCHEHVPLCVTHLRKTGLLRSVESSVSRRVWVRLIMLTCLPPARLPHRRGYVRRVLARGT
jgi:hypothetical protein